MKIVVYTARWCGPCTVLKSAFKNEKIDYTSIDIEASLKEASEAGVEGVPIIVMTDTKGNETRLIGFNPEVMKRVKKELNN